MPLPSRSTLSTFDGTGKINNYNVPPANPATDWSNPPLATGIGDVAALGQTTNIACFRLTLASTTGAMVLNNWWAVWANATPTTPVIARTGTGVFTITTVAVCSDEYDASVGVTNNITVNMAAAMGGLEGTTPGFINCSASGNVVTINTFNSSGAANDLAGVTIYVTVKGF